MKQQPHGKQRNDQHRTDEKGLLLLKSSLPAAKEFNITFNEQPKNDYGIDGEFQVFINERYTGEVYKAQLKSTTNARYSKNGDFISFPLDLDTTFLLIESATVPTALIIADVTNEKVFWHPIQADEKLRTKLGKKLSQEITTKNPPTISVRVPTKNLLTPTEYQELYNYFKQSHIKLSQEAIIRTRTSQTLSAGMKYVDEIERQILNIKGFNWRYRNENDPPNPGTMYSLGSSNGKVIDFLPNEDFRPEDALKVKIEAKFPKDTKDGQQKYKDLKSWLEKGTGSIDLENVKVEAVAGDSSINTHAGPGGVRMSFAPQLQKERQRLLITNGSQELLNEVDVWVEKGAVRMASVGNQPFSISTSFNPNKPESVSFNMRVNSERALSAQHELHIMNFIKGMKEVEIAFIDPEGFKRKLFWGVANIAHTFSEDRYKFIKALAEIEHKAGIRIPYPLPEKITNEEAADIFWLHRLLTEGRTTKDVTLNITLNNAPPEELAPGKAFQASVSSPEFSIFNKSYVLQGFEHTTKGLVTSVEKQDDQKFSYKIRLKNAEISLMKAKRKK